MDAPRRPTFQSIVKQRQQEMFVGRDEYVAAFGTNLDVPVNSEQRKYIFAISGQGGVGKSSLLQRYQRTLADRLSEGAIHAWIDHRDVTILAVMERIAREFSKHGFPLKKFGDRYQLYQEKRAELENDPNAPNGLANFVGQTAKFSLRLGGVTPAGPLLKYIDEDAAAGAVTDFVEYISRRSANRGEAKLLRSPIETLTPLFVSDLRALPEDHLIAIFFDTYELIGEYLDVWLRSTLDGRYGELPANILLVIAGRNELARNLWNNYVGVMTRISLEPFTEDEALQYLARAGITDTNVSRIIMQVSGRLPMLVAMLASESPADPTQIGDPSGAAVDRFLQWVENPIHRQLAIDAALPRHLNEDIVAELSNPEAASTLFKWLTSMPFVKEGSGAGWYYHDVVRSLLLRYKYRHSPDAWNHLHDRLAQYYAAHLTCEDHDATAVPSGKNSQRAKLAWLYHRLCRDSHGMRIEAITGFVLAFRGSRAYALRWAETMRQAGIDSEASDLQRWGDDLLKAAIGYRDARYADTVKGLSRLLESRVLAPTTRAIVWQLRGRCYVFEGKNRRALADFNAAVSHDPNLSSAFVDRGRVYLSMREIDKSLSDFVSARELSPTNASYVSLCAIALSAMKRFDEAIEQISQAVDLAPDKPVYLVTRADILASNQQFELALADLNRVLDIEPTSVRALGARGQVYEALNQFDGALRDFTNAIILEPSNAYLIGQRAIVYRHMNRYAESEEELSRAIALDATDAFLWYNRAAAYFSMRRFSNAQEDLLQALQLRPNFRSARVQLAIAYLNERKYDKALHEVDVASARTAMDSNTAMLRGLILEGLRLLDESEQMFSEAISLDSSSFSAYECRSLVRCTMERYDDALNDVNQAITIEPNSPELWAMQAGILRLLGRYQEAADEFERAFCTDEALREEYAADYGLTLMSLHKYQEAMECYESILAKDGEDYAALYNLAVAASYLELASAHEYVGAARKVLQAVLDTDVRGSALYGLGGLEALSGHSDAALDSLAQSIPLERNARAWARHDMAWEKLRNDVAFRALVF